jgi:hypothetical protein
MRLCVWRLLGTLWLRAVAGALVATLAPASLDAATITVGPGGNLQAAINSARPGDTVVLTPGATYVGNFTLPAPTGGLQPITIRTALDPRLPLPGNRIKPALHAAILAKIRSSNGLPAIQTALGAHHWRLELLEFGPTADGVGEIIRLGRGGSDQSTLSIVPHNLVIDRCYIHGNPVVGQKRGIALNSASTTIVNSHISDIKAVGIDTQAIGGWNGPGPFLIENNYLEAAGENVMFGGADPKIPGLVPSDITFRLNHLSKPRSWQQQTWSVKNLFELKNARRVLVEGNVFEHNWKRDQNGIAIVLIPRNQDGTAPWCVVSDVTFRYNIVRHAGGGFSLTGYDDNYPSQQARNILIQHNLVYDITSSDGSSGRFMRIGSGPANVKIEHNTMIQTNEPLYVYGRRPDGAYEVVKDFLFANNLTLHNTYGISGEAAGGLGIPTINAYFSGTGVVRNVLAGGEAARYPAGNLFPSVTAFLGEFVAGTYRLRTGSPFKNAGTDGTDLGPNMTTLESLTNCALSGDSSGVGTIRLSPPIGLRIQR